MTSPSEGSHLQPKAADQLDLSAEVPTAKSHRRPLQVQDEFSVHAELTPIRVKVSLATRVRSNLGALLTFLFIAIIALGAGSVVAGFGRLWDAPGFVALLLGMAAGTGTFIAGIRFCTPSRRGKRG
ncbi:hypothetical protein ACQP2P_10800 [Dactylosporangium sp. CA-139114]|uniref:hypothetical protein n=1 Tax=Dactylosporangium sp. CA-139114 TaxID=3239931 RepID=UPI003D96C98D